MKKKYLNFFKNFHKLKTIKYLYKIILKYLYQIALKDKF